MAGMRRSAEEDEYSVVTTAMPRVAVPAREFPDGPTWMR